MKLVVASRNKNKIREMREILSALSIEVVSEEELGLDLDVEETGTTFEENARLKAAAALAASGLPAVADDSGIEVAALDGRPGAYSARYGGDRAHSDKERYELLLEEMQGKTDRRARYVSAICCLFPDGTEICTRGECPGELLTAPEGTGGFGYDPIFFMPGEGVTMAQLSPERKNEISHRAIALDKFYKGLEKYNAHK